MKVDLWVGVCVCVCTCDLVSVYALVSVGEHMWVGACVYEGNIVNPLNVSSSVFFLRLSTPCLISKGRKSWREADSSHAKQRYNGEILINHATLTTRTLWRWKQEKDSITLRFFSKKKLSPWIVRLKNPFLLNFSFLLLFLSLSLSLSWHIQLEAGLMKPARFPFNRILIIESN